MIKGGYKIIDLQNKLIELADLDAVVIDGIYEEIEGNYRKATLLSGLHTTDGQSPATIREYADMFVTFVVESDDFVAYIPAGTTTVSSVTTASFIRLVVTDDDEVYASIVTTTDTQPEADAQG